MGTVAETRCVEINVAMTRLNAKGKQTELESKGRSGEDEGEGKGGARANKILQTGKVSCHLSTWGTKYCDGGALASCVVATRMCDAGGSGKVGTAPRAHYSQANLILAKYTCITLQWLNGSVKKVKDSLLDKSVHLDMDSSVLRKLQEAIEHPCRACDWFALSEQVSDTVYALCDRPEVLSNAVATPSPQPHVLRIELSESLQYSTQAG